ncbi:MAG: hypothetical protein U0992_20415 [Planctomycetaceae bacterium]
MHLAARRLVENPGAKFVTVIWDAVSLNAGSWDRITTTMAA